MASTRKPQSKQHLRVVATGTPKRSQASTRKSYIPEVVQAEHEEAKAMSKGRRNSGNGNGTVDWRWSFGMAVSLLMSAGSLGYSSGVLSTRVNALETSVVELKGDSKLMVSLVGDVRVIAKSVEQVVKSVERLERKLEK